MSKSVILPRNVVMQEIEDLKKLYNLRYLTKEKCRSVAGWFWGRSLNNQSRYAVLCAVHFDTEESETYYRIKWAEFL